MKAKRLKEIINAIDDNTEIFIRNSVNPYGNIQELDQVESSEYGFFGKNLPCIILNTDSSKRIETDDNDDIIDFIVGKYVTTENKHVEIGRKIVGPYGNKVNESPFISDEEKKKMHIVMDIQDIIQKTRAYMATLDNIEDQKKIMFQVMEILNPEQYKFTKEIFDILTDENKREFIKSAIDIGITIQVKTLDDKRIIDSINEIFTKFDYIMKP